MERPLGFVITVSSRVLISSLIFTIVFCAFSLLIAFVCFKNFRSFHHCFFRLLLLHHHSLPLFFTSFLYRDFFFFFLTDTSFLCCGTRSATDLKELVLRSGAFYVFLGAFLLPIFATVPRVLWIWESCFTFRIFLPYVSSQHLE